MQTRFIILLIILIVSACNSDKRERSDLVDPESTVEGSLDLVDNKAVANNSFDKSKWSIKEGKDYPYREQMLNDVVYNDTIRTLKIHEIIKLLGEPDYIREDHLYYLINQKRLLFWPLHTKTMVIKLAEDSTIDWIKIHE